MNPCPQVVKLDMLELEHVVLSIRLGFSIPDFHPFGNIVDPVTNSRAVELIQVFFEIEDAMHFCF